MITSKLKDIFDNGICPFEDIRPTDPQYSEIYGKIEEEEKYFIQKMSPDDARRFEEFESLFPQAEALFHYDCFAYGFRLGMHLMAEMFADKR